MWKQKIGLGLNQQFGVSFKEQLLLFKQTGFDAFFSGWHKDAPIDELAALAKREGLIFQSIHAPFSRMKAMWEQDAQAGRDALDELLDCLACCEQNGVPIMVAHAFIGFEDHTPTQAGLDRFGQLVRAAERAGVRVAFENTEGEEYLAALMDAFRGEKSVGFCWDTGHEMCYNHSQDQLSLYGDRLIATHINDNLGIRDFEGKITPTDDLHLLPFDGAGDWAGIAARLDRCGYNDILTLELNIRSKPGKHDNDQYARMPLPEYIAACFARACRVSALRKRA